MPSRPLLAAIAIAFAAACGSSETEATEAPADPASTSSTTTSTTTAPTTSSTVAPEVSTTTVAPDASTTTTLGATPACVRVTDFDDTTWFIVNDGVMGGRSSADGAVDEVGLTWTGTIVTAGGGFSSIRGPVDGELDGATSLTMRVRTDGRRYELLADDATRGQARVTHYAPIDAIGGDWEEVIVSLVGMEPRIFGSLVTAEPFVPDLATQIGVILADGVDGEFEFEIDWIDACP
ncbi:MAG: CIA30 family protein [Actinomycetota bacterium]